MAVTAAAALAGCGPTGSTAARGGTATSTSTVAGTGGPVAGATAVPVTSGRWPRITKVLTVIEENHSLAQMRAAMPYLDGLAGRYAYATDYRAVSHPSLPNYLSIAGGTTFGVTDDGAPSDHPIPGDSVFDQALTSRHTARAYLEAMSSNCQLGSSGLYAVKHNPWAYFDGPVPRDDCRRDDVPLGGPLSGALARDVGAGTLPDVGLVVPDLCHDAHNDGCTLGRADDWLRRWLPAMMAGPDFRTGRLAIVVTGDEDNDTAANRVLTVLVARALDGAHRVVTAALDHYSLSAWYSELSGSKPLHDAAGAPGMRGAFGLP